jgi:hypothetical protein
MMTRAEFARYMNVHKSQPTRWIRMGMPVLQNGGVDPEIGARWVARNIDRTRCAPVHGRIRSPLTPEPVVEDNVVECALRVGLVWLASRLPAAVATQAAEAGFDRADVARIYEVACAAAEEETRKLFEEMHLPSPLHANWAAWSHPGFDPMPAVEAELSKL